MRIALTTKELQTEVVYVSDTVSILIETNNILLIKDQEGNNKYFSYMGYCTDINACIPHSTIPRFEETNPPIEFSLCD